MFTLVLEDGGMVGVGLVPGGSLSGSPLVVDPLGGDDLLVRAGPKGL